MKKPSLVKLLGKIHADQRGAVSLETVLIIGVIAIPVLIFLVKYGWPRVKALFDRGMTDLESGQQEMIQ
ncbi:MAG: hypothetical protein JW809_18720 [Pirellulales bacterium]|nr:hypothetical protein [Pirellulales bacterium]